jgi:hypothetical protein
MYYHLSDFMVSDALPACHRVYNAQPGNVINQEDERMVNPIVARGTARVAGLIIFSSLRTISAFMYHQYTYSSTTADEGWHQSRRISI